VNIVGQSQFLIERLKECLRINLVTSCKFIKSIIVRVRTIGPRSLNRKDVFSHRRKPMKSNLIKILMLLILLTVPCMPEIISSRSTSHYNRSPRCVQCRSRIYLRHEHISVIKYVWVVDNRTGKLVRVPIRIRMIKYIEYCNCRIRNIWYEYENQYR
jgi:hypothetical protein